MSEPVGTSVTAKSITPDTLVAVKVLLQDANKKIFLKFKDLGPHRFPAALRTALAIPTGKDFVLERYSDSAGAYTALDPHNNQAYKTLYRAAKAKLKLRLRVTLLADSSQTSTKDDTESVKPEVASLSAPCTPLAKTEQPTSELKQPLPIGRCARNSLQKATEDISATSRPKANQPADLLSKIEAPVPEPFSADTGLSSSIMTHPLGYLLPSSQSKTTNLCSWSVYCNACGKSMPDAHFHCNICENSDYDLCESCVEDGQHCPGQGHWLIKRNVVNGNFVSSTTEKVSPRAKEDIEREIPGAFTTKDEKSVEKPEIASSSRRACNSCIGLFPEAECITCTTCEEFDLCIRCQIENKHGHHPAHTFVPVKPDMATPLIELLCSPNRGISHAAFCDGCDKKIVGVRHKCLTCPDWDYCSGCFKSAEFIHPRHRFAPVYEPLPLPPSRPMRHYGIYCDGPLCKDKDHPTYIRGIRYKCVICNDTDFCANCEASPNNKHNKTHPLMKFRSPVRNVSVMTSGEDKSGMSMPQMGDVRARRSCTRNIAIEKPMPSVNAATQVRGEVESIKKDNMAPKAAKDKIEIKDLLVDPVDDKVKKTELSALKDDSVKSASGLEVPETVSPTDLQAHCVIDFIKDGTKMAPGIVFQQVWALYNPGPHPWPVGCSVKYVGGDNTLNIDTNQPSTAGQVAAATESNSTVSVIPKGGVVPFRVVMRAPQREGRAISYWRVKAPDGTPFGHRLWCDINVEVPTASSPPTENDISMNSFKNTQKLPILTKDKPTTENVKSAIAELHADLSRRRAMLKEKENDVTCRKNDADGMPESAEKRDMKKNIAEPAESVEQDTKSAAVESSKMIFPQLERESPASSTHKDLPALEVNTEAKPEGKITVEELKSDASSDPSSVKDSPNSSTVAGTVGNSEQELFEDAESLRLEDSDGETFLTDEEYDILDASDEEFP